MRPDCDGCRSLLALLALLLLAAPRRRGGRNPGSDRYASRAELLANVQQAAFEVACRDQEPTTAATARRLGFYSRDGLEKALRRERIHWHAVKSDAIRRAAAIGRNSGRFRASLDA